MPIRRNPVDEAVRRARQQVELVVADVRRARLHAGLSQAAVARSVGCSRQLIGAVEAGRLEDLGCVQVARIGAAVGLDVTVRAYSSGSPLRDGAQLRLLQRFKSLIGQTWMWQAEAPVSSDPLERRAIDALLVRDGQRIGVEAVTRLLDVQAQVRAITLKQDAAGLGRMVLVLADTRHNRAALIDGAPTLSPAFPLPARTVLRDLASGRVPRANGVILI